MPLNSSLAVKVAVAMALGLGTMVGWKRIVVTVGEKIGKSHLTYSQGAADWFGLPVSTTHVLSFGVAGTMAANHCGCNGDCEQSASGMANDLPASMVLRWILVLGLPEHFLTRLTPKRRQAELRNYFRSRPALAST